MNSIIRQSVGFGGSAKNVTYLWILFVRRPGTDNAKPVSQKDKAIKMFEKLSEHTNASYTIKQKEFNKKITYQNSYDKRTINNQIITQFIILIAWR